MNQRVAPREEHMCEQVVCAASCLSAATLLEPTNPQHHHHPIERSASTTHLLVGCIRRKHNHVLLIIPGLEVGGVLLHVTHTAYSTAQHMTQQGTPLTQDEEKWSRQLLTTVQDTQRRSSAATDGLFV